MSRAKRNRRIAMLSQTGLSQGEIAELVGLSRSAVGTILDPERRAKERARKLRYKAICPDCGGPMTGTESGASKAAKRCRDCSNIAQREKRYWTAERVVEAIQRFASDHGGVPPSARDFTVPGTGYPALGSVYRSKRSKYAPFACWADAVEAAGFERPQTGLWRDRERQRQEFQARAAECWNAYRFEGGPKPGLGQAFKFGIEQVAAALQDGPLTRRELHERLGGNFDALSYALRRWEARGLVGHTEIPNASNKGRGRPLYLYHLVETPAKREEAAGEPASKHHGARPGDRPLGAGDHRGDPVHRSPLAVIARKLRRI